MTDEEMKLKAEIFDLQIAIGKLKKTIDGKLNQLTKLGMNERTSETILPPDGKE